MAVCSTQLWSMAIFEHKHFTFQCSDTFKGWWDILLSLYYKFIGKSASEKILKIGQHLAMLARKYGGTFIRTWCTICTCIMLVHR